METKTKPYAIRCSTEEQARECRECNIVSFFHQDKVMEYIWYTVITYEKAQSLGLLGDSANNAHTELSGISSELVEHQKNKVNNTPINRRVIVDWKWRKITVTKDWLHYCDWKLELPKQEEPQQNEVQEVKLLWTDTGDWITCEIWWYWKDWIYYIKDVINKRAEEVQEYPSEDNLVEKLEWHSYNNQAPASEYFKLVYKINEIIDIVNKHLLSK